MGRAADRRCGVAPPDLQLHLQGRPDHVTRGAALGPVRAECRSALPHLAARRPAPRRARTAATTRRPGRRLSASVRADDPRPAVGARAVGARLRAAGSGRRDAA
ncbi:hypothetical protein FRAHR75_520032 [Frankia sp. Hr75.2]|nr:hypothetical protein FRAHR75_520032 [Frankia sp. Hr75.2]